MFQNLTVTRSDIQVLLKQIIPETVSKQCENDLKGTESFLENTSTPVIQSLKVANKGLSASWECCNISVIPPVGLLRQEESKFQASLDSITGLCLQTKSRTRQKCNLILPFQTPREAQMDPVPNSMGTQNRSTTLEPGLESFNVIVDSKKWRQGI